MGFGSRGGVKAPRLPVVLIYLTLSFVVLLALGACGGEEPTPVPPPTTAPIVIAAPPAQPLPTLPPLPTAEPVGEPSGPASTQVVIMPGGRFGVRAPTAEPTAPPTEEPTAEPQPEPTPTPLPRPTPTVVIQSNVPTPAPVPVRNPSISVSPGSGQPGMDVTVGGTDFAPGSPVGAVNFGGSSASPASPVTVDSLGNFFATISVPDVPPGSYNLTMTVGTDSATASFNVEAAPSGPEVPAGSPIIATLAPLAGNLQWVAYFDNDSKGWSLYAPGGDVSISQLPPFPPRPSSLSDYAPLTQLISGNSYTFGVSRDVTISLGGKERTLTAGPNSVAW